MIVSQVLDELGISLDHELSEITPGLDKPHVLSSGAPVRPLPPYMCMSYYDPYNLPLKDTLELARTTDSVKDGHFM